ncbi:MAG: hypothetical protein HYX75_06365 [Acidobacteria bacterium]|nr:hypothetical protein [Acidobacteriota bacterium]
MWRIVWCLLALAIGSSAGTAADRPPVVSVKPQDPIVTPIGGMTRAKLTFVVASGFHVQANPPAEDYLIATRLDLQPSEEVTASSPVYPAGKKYRLEGSTEDLLTYEGTFEIVLPVKATGNAKPGERSLKASLRYQACDARSCLAPTSIQFEIPIRLVPIK